MDRLNSKYLFSLQWTFLETSCTEILKGIKLFLGDNFFYFLFIDQ